MNRSDIRPGQLLWLVDANDPSGLVRVEVVKLGVGVWLDYNIQRRPDLIISVMVRRVDERTGKPLLQSDGKELPLIPTDEDFLWSDKRTAAQSLEDTVCEVSAVARDFEPLLHGDEPEIPAAYRVRFAQLDARDGIPTTLPA